MEITFISDIHLNLQSKFKQFEKNRFNLLKEYLIKNGKETIILGGDILDSPSPTIEELGELYRFLEAITKDRRVILISGNHEDLSKNKCVYDEIVLPNVEYIDISVEPIKYKRFNLYFVSHHKIKDIKKINTQTGYNILFSHIRSNFKMVKQEISLGSIVKQFDTIFLGDIHQRYSPYSNTHYCGSPYSLTFIPAYDTGMFNISLGEQMTYEFVPLSFLPQKIKLQTTVDELLDTIKGLNPDNLYKIYVVGSEENFLALDLSKYTNIDVVFQPKDIPTTLSQKVVTEGQLDVIKSLQLLFKSQEGLSEEVIREGLEIINEIKGENDKI